MKTTQLCTPLFLMFAIACDDMNASIDVKDDTNTQRSEGDLEANEGARAGYLVKASRAIEAVARNNHLSLDNDGINCDMVDVSLLEEVESSCANMSEKGYTVELGNCVVAGGDTFDATIIVSAANIETSPILVQSSGGDAVAVLRGFSDWLVDVTIDGGSGSNVSACGEVNRSPGRLNLDYTMNIDGADGSSATYNVLTRRHSRFGRQGVINTRLSLEETSDSHGEPQEINVRTRDVRPGHLLPARGMARIIGAEPSELRFRPSLSADSMAQYRSLFHQANVVEIPEL